ncbi:MAG: FHA domain-containing protein [Chloroflexi bacterium]|nr:FHA domain-containing protein [Chloroflexota bacterium]
MNEIQARLVVKKGANLGAIFALLQPTVSIGRSADNDIALNDPEISRRHAQFLRQRDGYAVQDMGSANGVFVNSQPVVGLVPIYNGDVIALGATLELTYWDEEVTDSQPIPAPIIRKPVQETAVPPPPESALEYSDGYSPPTSPHLDEHPTPPAAPNYRRWFIGCGIGFLLLICLCIAAFIALDAYQQGRLLYCGGLRPFWEFILGPFGFNPTC